MAVAANVVDMHVIHSEPLSVAAAGGGGVSRETGALLSRCTKGVRSEKKHYQYEKAVYSETPLLFNLQAISNPG